MYQNVQKSVKNAHAKFLFCQSNPSFFLSSRFRGRRRCFFHNRVVAISISV